MTRLRIAPNMPDPDNFYDRLIGLHDGLTDGDSMALNARLILLLANHIGEDAVLDEAFCRARAGAGISGDTPSRA